MWMGVVLDVAMRRESDLVDEEREAIAREVSFLEQGHGCGAWKWGKV